MIAAVLLLGSTLTVMAGALLSPVVELMRADLGISGGAAGLVVTVHGLTLALASPLVGRAIDRSGVRAPLALGLVLYGLAGAAGLLLDDYPALIASRLVFGVGAAVVFVGTTVALMNLYSGADRDRMMGWRSTALSLGGVAFPLAAGALGTISWQAPFAVYLVGVPLGLAVLLVLPPTPPPAAAVPPERLPVRAPLAAVYGLQAVATLLLYGMLVFLPARLADLGVVNTAVVSLFSAALSLVMSIVALAFAAVRRRLGDSRLLLFAFVAWAAAFAVLAVAGTPGLAALAPILFGAGMGVAVPALTVLVGVHAPAAQRGQAVALLATATFAGQFLSPLLLGWVEPYAFVLAGALAAVVAVALAVRGRVLAPPATVAAES